MGRRRELLIFVLTVAGAAALLVSIAIGELLLVTALVIWVAWQPRSPRLPSYFIPMCGFIAATLVSLALSPDPAVNWALRKTVLFTMAVLTPTFVTTTNRARAAVAALIAVASVTSAYGLVQFVIKYLRFMATQQLVDDPTILARITGFMGHWQTFSGEQLIVWCAAIPAAVALGRRWYIPITTIGAALILSFTQGVWAGALAAMTVVFVTVPRRAILPLLIPLALIAAAASGLIYHRVSASLNRDQQFMPVTGRMALWKAGLEMIRERPWFGVGPERIAVEFPHHYRGSDLKNVYYGHLENVYLQIAAERGLVCFAMFAWFILELYAGLFRLLKAAPRGARWIALSGVAALTGFLVSGLFEYNFGDSEVQLLLLFVATMPFGVIDERYRAEIGRSVGMGDS